MGSEGTTVWLLRLHTLMEQCSSIADLVSCPQECHQIQACHLERQQVAKSSVDGLARILCVWQGNKRGGKFSSLQNRRKWCGGGMRLADELPTCFGIQCNCSVCRQVTRHRTQQIGGWGEIPIFVFLKSHEMW